MCHCQLMGTKLTHAARIFGHARALQGQLQKQGRLLPTFIFFPDLNSQNILTASHKSSVS